MAERNMEKIRAIVQLALTAARIGQSLRLWRIKELPQIEEVITMLVAVLDLYEEPAARPPQPA